MNNSSLTLFKEKWSLVKILLIGLIMILVGVLFVTFSSFATTNDSSLAGQIMSLLPLWVFNILSDLGIGIIAAGLLTITLEQAGRKKHQEDINDIKNIYVESILKALMPQPFFDEIKAHIIQQPFLRSNYQATIHLAWKDDKKEFLSMIDNYSYEVKNISRTIEEYEVRVYEDKMYEDKYPNCTNIKEIKTYREVDNPSFNKRIESLKNKIETEQFIEIRFLIPLKPNEKVTISQYVESVKSARDIYTYVMSKPTQNLRLTVTHPDDLILNHVSMHSSFDAFPTDVVTPTLKVWQIQGGILPFQGILLTWSPKT